jgi:hypothetical protein
MKTAFPRGIPHSRLYASQSLGSKERILPMQKPEQQKHLYRSGAFMAGLTMLFICFMFGGYWAWTSPWTPVGYVATSPMPASNPNERVEYLEGGILLRIPITPTPDTSKKTSPAEAEKKRD